MGSNLKSPITLTISTTRTTALEAVVKILKSFVQEDYYAYERDEKWHIGIDNRASLTLDPTGRTVTVSSGANMQTDDVGDNFTDIVTTFIRQHSIEGMKTHGYTCYNYAAYIRKFDFCPGRWPLVSLMVPRLQLEVCAAYVKVWNANKKDLAMLHRSLEDSDGLRNVKSVSPVKVDIYHNRKEYLKLVGDSLHGIKQSQYDKIIVSRQIDIPKRVDMIKTLFQGRQSNSPKRTFALRHMGFEATGFSPELVAAIENGRVTTEPLAGTRSNEGTDEERRRLREDLVNDPKEVMEHVISVREAIHEMNQFCDLDTVSVYDLMTIKERGKVQHLGSSVKGDLLPSKTSWDAFNVLFPSITATGIPKQAAMKAIGDLESRTRELYSGAVLLMDGSSLFEATLVLRSIFQDLDRQWVQTGAGIVNMSTEEREFTETCEKLKSFATFISPQDDGIL